ncbi:hypothetical protein MMC13_006067 [Lambiella insularis]|nr:hypothetical protein [Lambiella insularis]
MASSAAAGLLGRQLKQMQGDKDIPGISCGLVDSNVFEWEVMLMISDDCRYYGGKKLCRRLSLNLKNRTDRQPRWFFPRTSYLSSSVPSLAPQDDVPDDDIPSKQYDVCLSTMCSIMCALLTAARTTIVYANGDVCISILHPPEEDMYGYELAGERWSPVQTPETILLSVISLLSSPNDESPANIEAARLWREDPKAFRKRCRTCVRNSLGDE